MDWKLIDLKMEYMRMGIPNDYWVFSDLNEDFKVCIFTILLIGRFIAVLASTCPSKNH